MKRIVLIQLLLFTMDACVYCQNQNEKPEDFHTFNQGISLGVSISNYVKGGDWSFGHFHTLEATYDNKIRPGFYFGYLREFNITRRYYCQPEIYYNHNKNAIIYHDWIRSGAISTVTNADFITSYSKVSVSLLQGICLGENLNINLFGGPYFQVPFSIKYKGQILKKSINELTLAQVSSLDLIDNEIEKKPESGFGALLGIRFNIPLNPGFLGIDIRVGKSLTNIIELPDTKERFETVSIIYLFKIKQD